MAKHEIKAPVGGSVWTHSVGVGQTVGAGTVIMLCECMKTEFPIEAPVDGVVTWLSPCATDIKADDLIATMESAD